MQKTILYFTIALGISIFSQTLQAQFDPFNVKSEYFKDKKNHDLTKPDKDGNSYRILNSASHKGVQINMGPSKQPKWKYHGLYYDYEAGKIKKMTTYREGDKDGTQITYFENSTIKKVEEFSKGLPTGRSIQYYKTKESQEKKCEIITYDQGKRVTRVEYYENQKTHWEYKYELFPVLDSKGKQKLRANGTPTMRSEKSWSRQWEKNGDLIEEKTYEVK
jgi:antitoxin component YwqK of YwqJK toxin-antitoxin module